MSRPTRSEKFSYITVTIFNYNQADYFVVFFVLQGRFSELAAQPGLFAQLIARQLGAVEDTL